MRKITERSRSLSLATTVRSRDDRRMRRRRLRCMIEVVIGFDGQAGVLYTREITQSDLALMPLILFTALRAVVATPRRSAAATADDDDACCGC